jgi:hypothetical protein
VARFGADIPIVDCMEANCEGPLAEIYCGGPTVAAIWHFGLYRDCLDVMKRLRCFLLFSHIF